MRWAIVDSAYSSTVESSLRRRPQDQKHYWLIAWIHFLVGGSVRAAAAAAGARPSLSSSARDAGRRRCSGSRSNCSVMFVVPWEAGWLMLMAVRPAMVANCFSSGERQGGSDRPRACARKRRAHLDRGVVNGWQIAHREQAIGHDAEHEDAQHDERRRDRGAF